MSTPPPTVTELAKTEKAKGPRQSARSRSLQPSSRSQDFRVPPETRVVLSNAASLVGTYVVTSALGLGFWLLAAHYYSKATVGLVGGLVSAMLLVGGIATLGLGTMLVGELPRRAHARRGLVASAMTVSAVAGAVGGLFFALGAPVASSEYQPLIGTSLLGAVFVIGVGLTSAGAVFDQAAIGALRGGVQLWRNFLFASAKLGAIAVFTLVAGRSGVGLLSAWIAGIALSLIFMLVRDRRRAGPLAEYRPRLSLLSGLWRDAIGHQAYNIAYTLPVLTLPIVVLGLASASANATFYVALQVASALYVVPTALTMVLFAAGASDVRSVPQRLRLTLKLSGAIVAVGVVAFGTGGSWIVGLFGPSYVGGGSVLLVLALAAIPLTIKSHFIAVTRIERRVQNRLGLVWGGALAEIAGGTMGAAHSGAIGAALGWLLALCIETAVMAPILRRAVMSRSYFRAP